jgi:hypothetical protein
MIQSQHERMLIRREAGNIKLSRRIAFAQDFPAKLVHTSLQAPASGYCGIRGA